MNYRKTNKHTIERLEYEDGEVMFDLVSEVGTESTSTLHCDIPSLIVQILENEGDIDIRDNVIARLENDDIKNLGEIIMGAVKTYIEVAKGIRKNHYR